MLINSPTRQPGCNRLILQQLAIVVIAMTALALTALPHLNNQPAATWVEPSRAEPNLAWPTSGDETDGLVPYEINAAAPGKAVGPTRFVF